MRWLAVLVLAIAAAVIAQEMPNKDLLPDLGHLFPADEMHVARPWQAPNYSGQEQALGYAVDTFAIPPQLATRVAFWQDIYGKYTTRQGVIHDSLYIDLIYEVVDFKEIDNDPDLTPARKEAKRERLVKERKRHIVEQLKRLQKIKEEEEVAQEDLELWRKFKPIDEKDKFLEAAKRHRLRFQLGQKDRILLGLYYSGRYIREMERIFREQGLPIELTRLPFVESSFNIYARSRVGASGIWQFMRRTARPFMQVNTAIDERNDPIRATYASARLLRQNYELLESWPLALTGYNHGANGIKRIVRKLGTRDLPEIIDRYSSRRFGFASENFYACFLAVLEIEKKAPQYFGEIKWSPELDAKEVEVTKPLAFAQLLELFSGNETQLRLFNPHLLKAAWKNRVNIPKRTIIRVPAPLYEIADDLIRGKIKQRDLKERMSIFLAGPPKPASTEAPTSDGP